MSTPAQKTEISNGGLEPLTVTVRDAKHLTGLGVTTLYKLIGNNELQTVKIGARTLIVYSSIKKRLGLGDA